MIKLKAMVLAMLAILILSACSGAAGSSEGSRSRLFDSIETLSDASSTIVVGTVEAQEVVRDIDGSTPFTVSTMSIIDRIKGVADSETLEVRQTGGAEVAPLVSLLALGKTYLLYLTPSGLDSPLDSQFYVTGANAGLYYSDSEAMRGQPLAFTQLDPEPAETLPSSITTDDAFVSAR